MPYYYARFAYHRATRSDFTVKIVTIIVCTCDIPSNGSPAEYITAAVVEYTIAVVLASYSMVCVPVRDHRLASDANSLYVRPIESVPLIISLLA